MRRILPLILLFFALAPCIPLLAQDKQAVPSTWDKAYFLSGHSRARFALDLSEAVINGVEAEDFKAMEPEWKTGVKDMTLDFVQAFNKAAASGIQPFRIGSTMETELCFVLKVGDVTEGGACVEGVLEILSADGTLLFAKPVYARKGMFGTQLNLMGDALVVMGAALGGEVSNRFRAPDSNLKELKQAVKGLVKDGETIALRFEFSDYLLTQLVDREYAKAADEAFVAGMEKTFFDSFKASLAKSLGPVPEDKVFVAEENPSGAVMTVRFIAVANRQDETDMFAEVFLKKGDGTLVYGILNNGEITGLKKFCDLQMERMGKKLGKIK